MDTVATSHPDRGARYWFLAGAAKLFSAPAIILMGAFVGFAGFAKESGIEAVHAMFMTAMVWALPAKVILVAATASGTGLLATAFAVALSSVRMMMMVGALVPEIRAPKTRTWVLLFLSHFVAITGWVLAMETVQNVPRHRRTIYFAGIGITLTSANVVVVGLVYTFAGQLPVEALGALFFLTPVYFLTSLWATARDHVVKIAMVCGLILGPLFHLVAPDFDLLLAGFVGGVAAFFLGKLLPARGVS
ncbi:MAG: AzlC family ABC transporter permease [Ahrensia sp.]